MVLQPAPLKGPVSAQSPELSVFYSAVGLQLLEAETVQHIFSNNYQLCSEISESVLQHFIHCLATHGRHVQYLNFLHTIIKAEGKYVKKCQDMIMTEVRE